jgi:hypothetical protein
VREIVHLDHYGNRQFLRPEGDAGADPGAT